MIRTLIKKTLAAATANRPAQRLLERMVIAEQWLMGIGSGSVPETSGEEIIAKLLREKARNGKTLCIFDVGANRGQFLSMLKRGLGEASFQVHAFEPSHAAFEGLKEIHANDARAILNNIGLSRMAGSMTLYSNEVGSGLASLYERRLDHFGITLKHAEQVAVETLDAYCVRTSIDHIDLLKIDVEGHELDVLAGAEEMLHRGAIDAVTFEFGGCNIDSRRFLQDFFYFFRNHGSFTIHRITPSGFLTEMKEYRETHEQFRTTNFLVRRVS
jgi:FkbM family methyltransferase